jgi:predicted Rdx family selenoprotein
MPSSKIAIRIAAIGSFVLLAACGAKSLSGTYTDMAGNVSLDFQSGGKVRFHASETGYAEQDTYTVDGKKVTVRSSGGTVGIFEIQTDGCLNSPTMGEMCKPRQ